MLDFSLLVPKDITFSGAIAFTQTLLEKMETGELSPDEISTAISRLIKAENGARGFFVTYLTSDLALADNPSQDVVQALQTNPEIIAELLVKNLAMSAAQVLSHRRQGNEELAQASEQVRDRTAHLIGKVKLTSVYENGRKLWESALTGEGSYKEFLERWNYDKQQRQAICEVLDLYLLPHPL
ncbi:MAG: hypothetical protein NVS2B14_06680 [Chamaesiphon sp.]